MGEQMQIRMLIITIAFFAAVGLALTGYQHIHSGNSGPATAYSLNACPSVSSPSVSVTMNLMGPNKDQKISIVDLTEIARKNALVVTSNHSVFFSTTDMKGQADLNIQVAGADYNGSWCVYPTKIEVTVNWLLDVHIAAELKPGTCLYQFQLEHADVFAALYQAELPNLKRQLEAVARDGFTQPVRAAIIDSADNMLLDRIKDSIMRHTQNYEAVMDRKLMATYASVSQELAEAHCPKSEIQAALGQKI